MPFLCKSLRIRLETLSSPDFLSGMSSPTIPTWDIDFFPIEQRLRALPTQAPIDLDFTGRPVVAAIYTISGLLMRILGPVYWAAVIVLFVYAELFTS